MQTVRQKMNLGGPKDDDELHAWIKNKLGVDIPRAAVCEGHHAPFQFLADLYFERTDSAILMANRGGSKTFSVAVLHLLNMLFKPGVECCTVGAIEAQAKRAYAHFLKLLEKEGKKEISRTLISETLLKNGSRLEIMPGTISAVNGPHPQKVHFDEVELADPEVYEESRNMSQSTRLADGRLIRSQDIITSTRKRGHGMMQTLLDQVNEAKLQGLKPPYELYVWCVFEAAEEVPNCQIVRTDLDPCDTCDCDKVVKGRWEDGSPRTLRDACKGRFYRSRGFVPLDDIVNTFTKTSRAIWEAQQECSKPSTEGMVLPQFTRERHGIMNWDADPELGPIFMSIDFGGTDPHAVHWYQILRHEVEAITFHGTKRRIPQGSRICFDEIYRAEIGNNKIAEMIVDKERAWRRKHKKWKSVLRFSDPAAKAARLDFARNDPPMPTVWYVTREVEEHIKLCNELIEDEKFYVDVKRCPMFTEEAEAWHRDKHDRIVEYFDHAMAGFRYAIANMRAVEDKLGRPRTVPHSTRNAYQPIKLVDQAGRDLPITSNRLPRSEQWRRKFGAPIQLPPL